MKKPVSVWLLYRNNDEDYYVKYHYLIGVFSTKKLAQDHHKKSDPMRPIDPKEVNVYGDWYEIEEAHIDKVY